MSMCPDDEMLSAYLDGELTPDSVRSVEAKLSGDSEYRTRYKEVAASSEVLHSYPEPDFDAAQERVWERIQASTARSDGIGIFRRRIVVPMPLAAAA
ncbi:MAG: anti-sigma factor family protein, partial [Spirochaetia bacterium]